MVSNHTFRNWCFTSFAECRPILDENNIPDGIKYICFQQERCPNSAKLHYQGYLECNRKTTMKQIKLLLKDDAIHLEPRYGTQEAAIAYCSKSNTKVGDFFEYGIKSRQGNRTDLDSIFEFIENGATVRETMREFGGHAIRYVNHIERTTNILWGRAPIDEYIESVRRTRLDYITHTGIEIPEVTPYVIQK